MRKGRPVGALSGSTVWIVVGSDTQARGGERGVEAEGHQEERGDPVEATFEVRERHDTPFQFGFRGAPGERGRPSGQVFCSTI
jgi:hypothetical protein